MARVEVYEDRLVIKLTSAERILALRRRDITLDRSAITQALITDDPWVWVRGVRAPGAHLPGSGAVGTWRTGGGKDFTLIKPNRLAVVLDLEVPADQEVERGWVSEFDSFSRLILSTTHAAELIAALKLEGESAVFDTEE